MWQSQKRIVYTASIVGIVFLTVGLSKVEAGVTVDDSQESLAARFAKGYERSSADNVLGHAYAPKEESDASDMIDSSISIARSVRMLSPKFSDRELREKRDQLREKRGQGRGDRGEVARAGTGAVSQGGGGANRRNGSGGGGRNNTNSRNGNRQSVSNRSGLGRNESGINVNNMKANSGRGRDRGRNKEDCGRSNPLHARIGCESIAETLTRTQLHLKPGYN